jgi:hypothetical protein
MIITRKKSKLKSTKREATLCFEWADTCLLRKVSYSFVDVLSNNRCIDWTYNEDDPNEEASMFALYHALLKTKWISRKQDRALAKVVVKFNLRQREHLHMAEAVDNYMKLFFFLPEFVEALVEAK